MNRFPVIIDCDPGVDDTAALLLASRMDELDIRGITTVAGNVGVDKTTANAIKVRHAMGEDIPIFMGADRPMFRDPVTAEKFHGEDGFGDVIYPKEISDNEIGEEKAWDAIYRIAKECNGELIVIAVGPMTNLGIALSKYKDLPQLIKRIVIMGGAAIGGNITPSAEFNIYVDPEAADMLFCCGVPVYMCGLDVTLKAYMTPEEIEEIGALGSFQAKLFRDVLQGGLKKYLGWGYKGVALHDPVAVLYAVDDSIFETHHVGIRVETKGLLTLGKTVTDLLSDKQMEHNAYIVTNVNREAFLEKVKSLMSKF
ncbi:pyrimidine-specific ribonucleoside hydrolase RihA [Anaerotignum neopropionicum]|uniref:Pyrimidine-specific ribonucleoside hydrolase RihA n=1 Tax=Anaerotignum neopropionicum TaxID=36847 RepID=A0A136WFK2_9FIRM|nr:nucleoside hydrolase [Anaerotignum neopropionicum]KXL53285.1 pyrimidine-specific ribonucleoside hydrolase RihA [Anaerotignum neopropionicum]